ncbi:MAG TPA: TRAP transporter small permease [Casimicrobiaceae bacterium]|nr:TRAP transporter small permease [Casimicrobiaceae bacterium]
MSEASRAARPGEAERDSTSSPSQDELAERIESHRLPRGVAGAFVLLLCAVTPFLTFAISYDVVVRYIFNSTLLWVNDVTGYLLAALTFLGGAYVMSHDGHTRVDILITHAGAKVRRWLTLFDAALVLVVCIILAVTSGYAVWDSYVRKVSVVGIVEVPRYVVLAPIFIGTVLLCVERIGYIRRVLRRLVDVPISVEAPRV